MKIDTEISKAKIDIVNNPNSGFAITVFKDGEIKIRNKVTNSSVMTTLPKIFESIINKVPLEGKYWEMDLE